jgi:hypothetical protein
MMRYLEMLRDPYFWLILPLFACVYALGFGAYYFVKLAWA